MTNGWRLDTYRSTLTGRVICQEVLPENDKRPHISDTACACRPTLEAINGVVMLVHNAFDGREKYENLRDQ